MKIQVKWAYGISLGLYFPLRMGMVLLLTYVMCCYWEAPCSHVVHPIGHCHLGQGWTSDPSQAHQSSSWYFSSQNWEKTISPL